MKIIHLIYIFRKIGLTVEPPYSEPSQRSKIELFAKITAKSHSLFSQKIPS